jgi:protocatechuate 3,4-dioxygenase beta subunit
MSSGDLSEVAVAPTSETTRAADDAQELPQAFALSLVDRDGNLVSGASIKIYRRPRFHFANLDPSVMAADMIGDVLSNEDGLSGFAAEDGYIYDLAIEAEGFATRRYRLTDPGTKRIVLRRKASVWGHVWDEAGEPLAGVPVELEHDQGIFLRALTTDDGQFEFKNVVPTAATLRIQSPTHQRDWRQIVVEGGTRHYREFFLQSGQSLNVTVVDDSGIPIEDAAIDLVELNSGLCVASLQTNAAGDAQFGAIAPQSSYLVSVDGGAHGLVRQVVPTASSAQANQLSMTVVMGGAWNITGQLLSQDGMPIAGAVVVLECAPTSSGAFDSRHRVTVRTDEFGQFDSGALLAGGNYTVLSYHPSFASTVSTGWTPLNSNGLVMTMGFPNSIFGTIVGPSGEGVPNAMVFLTVGGAEPGTAGSVLVAQTGSDGGYQFTNIAAGNVSLEAISLLDSGSTGSVNMTVGNGAELNGSLGVGGDAGASGRVNIQIKN